MALSYRKAWKLLEKSTPLTSDCGTLCGGACCKGSGEEGMLLFPHEELMYASCPDGFTIRDSNITLASGYHVKFLTCRGQCPRNQRPLSCRIFPVIPYIGEDQILEFVPDLRGAAVCPLLFQGDQEIRPEFIDDLYAAFKTLLRDDDVLEFITLLSRENDALAEAYGKLL